MQCFGGRRYSAGRKEGGGGFEGEGGGFEGRGGERSSKGWGFEGAGGEGRRGGFEEAEGEGGFEGGGGLRKREASKGRGLRKGRGASKGERGFKGVFRKGASKGGFEGGLICGGTGKKSAKFWAPTHRGPTLRGSTPWGLHPSGSTLWGSHFFQVWALQNLVSHPSGRNPSGPHTRGPALRPSHPSGPHSLVAGDPPSPPRDPTETPPETRQPGDNPETKRRHPPLPPPETSPKKDWCGRGGGVKGRRVEGGGGEGRALRGLRRGFEGAFEGGEGEEGASKGRGASKLPLLKGLRPNSLGPYLGLIESVCENSEMSCNFMVADGIAINQLSIDGAGGLRARVSDRLCHSRDSASTADMLARFGSSIS